MVIAIFVGLLLILFLLGFAVPYALVITSIVGMIYSGSFNLTAAIYLACQGFIAKTGNGLSCVIVVVF